MKLTRIPREVSRLPVETRNVVNGEIAQAEATGEDLTPTRKMLDGEKRKGGYDSWKCSGMWWPVDHIKTGAIQQCPREDLEYIRYNLGYDMVERLCKRCGEYVMEHPDDPHFRNHDVEAEIPKTGWRPDPMTPGWKP